MKTAFAYWENRIAPVFDIAQQILIVENDANGIVAKTEEILVNGLEVRKVIHLAQLGIATLVCGAISRSLHDVVMANGIEVISFVSGELGDVIQAWLDGKLDHDNFAMPGCCGRGLGYRRVPCCGMKEEHMRPGSGSGQGQGHRGGPRAGGAAGLCVCVQCGHREPHQRGVPCVQMQCPKCGAALTRE